jgi:F-type H+-transporting ATPase subunit b
VVAEPALAADAHAHADPHGEKKGPLDFTGIKRWDLGIYTLVVFGLLMFIVGKYAWPNIKIGLEKREVSIRSALDEARRDRADAEVRLAEARKQLAEAAAQAKAILDEARKDAEALRAEQREAGVKDAEVERERARRETATKQETMVKEVQQQAVELAVLIATKAIRQQVTVHNQSALLDESIAELKSNASRA